MLPFKSVKESELIDPLLINQSELATVLGVLFKLGIQSDMKKRGIAGLEEYIQTLAKEYYPATPKICKL